MKYPVLASILLCLLGLSGFSQGWVLENPYPTYQHLFAVDFPSESVGYIAGDNGTLMKTIDGGSTWQQVNLPAYFFNSQIRNVNFIDNEKGFIALGKKVYKTTNGGYSWSASTQLNVGTLQGTYFLDQNNGFAFGSYKSLAKTTDGGNTWNAITYSPMVELHYSYLGFADLNTGYVVAQDWYFEEAVVQKTNNGGLTWTDLYIPDEIQYVSGLCVLSPVEIWIGAGNTFWNPQTGYSAKAYHTTDGGISWTSHNLGPATTNTGGVLDIRFFNRQEGRIVNLDYIYTTHDGGNTWSSNMTGAGACVSCFTPAAWTGEQSVYIAGYTPSLIYTNDCGQTKQDLILGGTPLFWTTYFRDASHGYVGGSYNGNAMIRYTNDAGATWHEADIQILPGQVIYDIVFPNSSTGWACYDDGLLRSVDGGYTWTVHPSAGFSMIYKNASFPASNAYYIAGFKNNLGGKIYKSTDQGNTWTEVFAGVSNYYKDCGFHFTDASTGFMALKPITTEYPGKLMKTTDGGITWNTLDYGDASEITALSFSSNQKGVIALANKKVLYTRDGGNTWTSATTQFPAPITYLRLFDPEKGVAAIKGQYLYHTNDGGITFEEVYHGSVIWPYSSSNAYFTDQNHGWASGFQGMVMRYVANLTSLEENPFAEFTTVGQSLTIYPNPAGSTITIKSDKYSHNSTELVNIYTSSGILIMQHPYTSPEMTINISTLASGLYFVVYQGEGMKLLKK